MKRFTLNKTLTKLLGIVIFALLWQILSMIIGQDSFIFPSPSATLKETIKMLGQSYIYKCIYQTMIRMVIGFLISLFLSLIFGILAGNNDTFKQLLSPTITVLKSLPTASLVYLFIIIVGSKNAPLLIVILVSFPILYEGVVGGIKSVPIDLLEASSLDGSTITNTTLHIKLPLALPYIVVGISSSFALSLKIEIMAEVITGYTRLGLGSAILAAQRNDPTNMVPVFAYSLVAIVIMLIIDVVSDKIKQKYATPYM